MTDGDVSLATQAEQNQQKKQKEIQIETVQAPDSEPE
jgi:hypothetical protein